MTNDTSKRKRIWISIGLWVLAFLLTALIAVYQKKTGPTWPLMDKEVFDGKEISYRLLRTAVINEPIPVRIKAPDPSVTGYLKHKRHNTDDPWTEIILQRKGDLLMADIPSQKKMGAKIEYIVQVMVNGKGFPVAEGKSLVARFKGEVPFVYLIIHIFFMFFSILFALRVGMEVLRKVGNYVWMVTWTLGLTALGGLVFGPIVQKYAFGDAWTGLPWGTDLTDNKILIAVIFWIIAFFMRKKNKWMTMVAVAVMMVVYLIPHSVLGSEYDYNTGQMKNKFSSIQMLEPDGKLQSTITKL
jgi:hypothetical protein